jgi:hypothetical protein
VQKLVAPVRTIIYSFKHWLIFNNVTLCPMKTHEMRSVRFFQHFGLPGLIATIMFFAFINNTVAQSHFYVKHDAAGINDGSSWDDAYTSLQTALASANTGDVIWVAAGTCLPTQESGGTGNEFKTFQLKNGVELYGGFAGNEDPSTFELEDRDFEINETILSGDLGGGVQVYHVFRHVNLGLNSTAVLDGFTISGGKANGSDPDNKGGGMLNSGTSSANGSSPTIRNCVFKNNEAAEGGAIFNSRYSNPVITRNTFLNNTATLKGGAVFNIRNTPTFSHCNFNGNAVTSTGSNDGGGAIYNTTSNAAEGPTISHCYFNDNTVSNTSKGGAINSYLNPGQISISHSGFTANIAQYGGALYHNSGSDANRDASNVQINNSSFEQNNAVYGGAIFSDRHHSMITSCIIRGNEATEQSGGFYGRYASSEIVNSLISGNKAGKHGGGIYFNVETPEIINSTITGNYSGERGGGISMIGGSSVALKNSIVWGNASPEGNELWLCATCTANIDHSLFANAAGDVFITSGGLVTATNSLNSNPVFLNPYDPPANTNTPNILGNYFICGCTSPCIDAGLNSHLPAGITQDLRGTNRFLDGNDDGITIIDLGAYEFDPNGCNALAPFAGDGSAGNPYEISMLQHLYWVAVESSRWDKHYIQTADIDACNTQTWFGGAGWAPIGNATVSFSGSYNGQGHAINNLHINRPALSNQGLFGLVKGISTQKVVIRNLTLIDVSISGYREVGALFGLADQWVDIINCHVSGTISGNRNTGGLAGWGRRTDFLHCSSSANVEMNNISNALYHGGLIGHINTSSTVKQSFATGNVSGRGRVGGLLGVAGWSTQVENCFARGNVESDISNPMIGGLIGEVWNAGVRNSYSTGIVNMNGNTSDYGGLVGNKTTSSNYFDDNNFWDTQTSGLSTSEMGTGKTTSEMETISTFTNWDFTDIWAIETDINDGYPHLKFSLFTWTGNQSTAWNEDLNWSPQAIPTTGHSIHIPGALLNYPVLDQSRILMNLHIAAGASLTIPPETGLTINGSISNSAGNNGLVIKSDASGTGSLIHHTAGVEATIERYIARWTDDKPNHGWHFLSSMVAAQPIRPEFVPNDNPIPAHIDFYKWEEPGKLWINVKDASGNWNTGFEDNFTVGKGYLLAYGTPPDKSYGNKAHQFTGMINVTDVSLTGLTNSGGDHDGWHLLGNPFSSAIKFNQGSWNKTNIGAYAQIWDQANASYKVLAGSQIIPSHNGFMIYTTGNGSLTIPTDARLHSDTSWYKNTGWDDLLILTVKDPAMQTAQETMIRFDHNATAGFDLDHDSYFMAGYAPMFYSISENMPFALNTLNELSHGLTIPLGFIKTQSNNYKIELTQSPPDIIVYLADLKTNATHNLTQNPVYTFSAESGDDPRRFLLQFEIVGVYELPGNTTFHAYTYGSTLYVHNQAEKAVVEVYNIQGQIIMSQEIGKGLHGIPAKVSPGAYIVRMTTESITATRKVII